MKRLALAIDGDGVIFDYSAGYINNWEKIFGYRPKLLNPAATLVTQRYGIPKLSGDVLEDFQNLFDFEFWSTLPILDGADEAIQILAEDYELHLVTAIDQKNVEARWQNLGNMPFKSIIATPTSSAYDRRVDISPKAKAVSDLKAVAFVDDYLPFHRGIDTRVYRALISPYANDPSYRDSFNQKEIKNNVNAVYNNLLDFARDF